MPPTLSEKRPWPGTPWPKQSCTESDVTGAGECWARGQGSCVSGRTRRRLVHKTTTSVQRFSLQYLGSCARAFLFSHTQGQLLSLLTRLSISWMQAHASPITRLIYSKFIMCFSWWAPLQSLAADVGGGNRHHCGRSWPPRSCCGWGMELGRHLKSPTAAGPGTEHSGVGLVRVFVLGLWCGILALTLLCTVSQKNSGGSGDRTRCTQGPDSQVPPGL